MIYFFDNELNMIKVATSKNVISAVHEHELNGLILGTVETDLSYTEAFINDVDYFGYYYKDNYYLHKIKRVEHEHENELVRITGRHIFFEDMLYGDYIRDVRPVNRDALYILNQTISANTRWQTVMTDTSKLHSETYYWVPPMEVLNDLTENVGIEYEPRILFDGQNINGFQLHVANRIGEDTPIRVPFGSRVLNLKYEVDYSEIVTALYGHGKGEEVGDGYGRRINFSSVNFSRNGVFSPSGQLYMENPNVTDQYGKDDGSPKFGRIIFEDIESASELANATYEAYLEQSRPKMLFEASVVDLGDVGMGDGVLIIRREYDVHFNARIHKLMVDLLDAKNADVELGDYAHFKESKVQRKTRENNNQYRRETSSRIQQLKEQFNERFDGEVNQMLEDFEQALIDAHAEIQAAEERMETLITTTRNDWTEDFEAEVAEIYRKADEDYNRIEAEITGVINSTREEMEMEFNESVQNTRAYAEQQAQERADAVQLILESATSDHQGLIDDLYDNVVDFNNFRTDINSHVNGLQSKVTDFEYFLGDVSSVTLDQRFLDMNQEFDQRIKNSTRDASNMLRGSRFDEPDMFNQNFNGVSLHTTEHENFIRLNTVQSVIPIVIMNGEIHLHDGVEYHLHIEYRTDTVTELDGFVFYHNDGTVERLENKGLAITGLTASGAWEHASMTLSPNSEMSGRLAIGTRRSYGTSPDGTIDVRLPYLTTTAHDQWLPHPRDANQNITEISRRITNLEDGYQDMIVRSDWDAEMGQLTQLVRDYETTVEGVQDRIIEIEDMEVITRGREVLDTVDGFSRKVWLGDIDRPNLIPHSSFENRANRDAWGSWGGWQTAYGGVFLDYAIVGNTDAIGNIGITSPPIGDYLTPGETYTLSWEASTHYPATTDAGFDYTYLVNVGESDMSRKLPTPTSVRIGSGTNVVYRKYELTFVAPPDIDSDTKILFGTHTTSTGINAFFRFRHPKLEVGELASPFKTSFSMLEQRSDQISMAVADLEGDSVTQSEFNITADAVEALVSKTDGHDTQIGNLSVSYDEISATVVSINKDVESYGTWINQTDSLISSKVWMNDIADVQPNLIPMANFDYPQSIDFWSGTGGNATAVDSDGFYVHRSTNSGMQLGIFSPYFDLKSGYEYIFSVLVKGHPRVNENYHWTTLQGENTNWLGTPDRQTSLGNNIYRNEYIFTAENSGLTRIRIGAYVNSGYDLNIRIKEPKIERGNVRTPFLNSFSAIEQTAEEIRLAVQGIDGSGFLSQSDIQIRSDYVQLGSQRIDGDNLGSLLRVSPSGIDAVAEAMRLSGDLYVDGDITTIAVDAIEGEFARLWADEFSAITIDVDDIQGFTARFEWLYTLNANIEKLVAQNVFADGVTALVGNFVDVNAGNIVTSGLSANVISSSHINSSNALIEKLFSNSARIDTLITKTHFVNEINAMSIDAVYANISDLRTRLLTADVITSNHIKVENALIDKMFASTALIERLTSKSAFIRDIQAIEITANQLNLTTLTNRINQIEGGLRITRPDGVDWVRNGQARGHVPVQIFDSYSSDEVGFTGLNFYTGSSNWQTFKYFYTPHEGTRLRITWAVGLNEGPSAVEYMEVSVRNFSSYSPINNGTGISTRRVTIRRGETTYVTQDVPMRPPTYNQMAAYLEFRRAPDGQSVNNVVRARILHIGQYE